MSLQSWHPRPMATRYGAALKSNAPFGAGESKEVFAAAANSSGAVLWAADWCGVSPGGGVMTVQAGATAPTSLTSREVLALAIMPADDAARLELQRPVFVPPGYGLYFFSNAIVSAGGLRTALYTLL